MIIIITMAGNGERFRRAGYNCPKYMIMAKEKTLFEWSMDSLSDYNKYADGYVFVVKKQDNAKPFILEKMKYYGIKNIEVVEIDGLTDGQATTALIGVNKCPDNKAVLFYNIDTYIEPNNLLMKDLRGDGSIPCFIADGDHWSFVREENGKVCEVVEKRRISSNCSLGVYYFKTAKLYKDIYSSFYNEDYQGNEKYIAPMYNYMINKGYDITYSIIDNKSVHVLGTPEELNIFLAS